MTHDEGATPARFCVETADGWRHLIDADTATDAGLDVDRAYCPAHDAPADALFTWAHEGCAGTFKFHERLPKATVYACAACGQHRVRQDDPAAHDARMRELANALIDAAELNGDPPLAPWCRTCGNEVSPEGKCCCWGLVADALQRYLGMDFDGAALMASQMWDAIDPADRAYVWAARYADDHDVTTYPDERRFAPAEVRAQDHLNFPHDDPCPVCGRRQWAIGDWVEDPDNPSDAEQQTCGACGYVWTDEEVPPMTRRLSPAAASIAAAMMDGNGVRLPATPDERATDCTCAHGLHQIEPERGCFSSTCPCAGFWEVPR
jgi:hypothetical protein